MYSPNGFVASSSRTKKNAICNQPLAVIRISPGAKAPLLDMQTKTQPLEAAELYRWSSSYLSRSHARVYASAIAKNAIVAKIIIASHIVFSFIERAYQSPYLPQTHQTNPIPAVV